MAGVRPEGHRVVIMPHLYDLDDLSGTAITPSGPVHYRYQKCANGQWRYEVRLSENTEGLFIAPSGKQIPFTGQLLITV